MTDNSIKYTAADIMEQLVDNGIWDTYKNFPAGADFPTAPIGTVNPAIVAGVKLAINLIDEEVNKELLPALERWCANPSLENLVEILDGIIDMLVVGFQAAYTLDLPVEQAFCEVHASNMNKLMRDEAGNLLKREDGKLLKPAGWQKPDIMNLILLHHATRQRQFKLGGAENWRPE